MAGEPELSAGSGGEWVLYLQQSLNHHYQQQVIAESGDFDDALTGVVRHFQRQQGLDPTGVADVLTWQALTGDAAVTRYRWPETPVAAAAVQADGAVVELALTLTGELADLAAADELLADLTVDLTAGPPALTGPAFLQGTPALADGATLESTGDCHLDGVWYRLTVTVPPGPAGDPPDSVAGWLQHHEAILVSAGVVALTATAGPVEVDG
jgi:hypothetical protein